MWIGISVWIWMRNTLHGFGKGFQQLKAQGFSLIRFFRKKSLFHFPNPHIGLVENANYPAITKLIEGYALHRCLCKLEKTLFQPDRDVTD